MNLGRARPHGGEGVGGAAVAVVVGVHGDPHIGERQNEPFDGRADLVRERAAVRVAGAEPVRAARDRRAEARERVSFVVLEPVEEVLGVEDHFPLVLFQESHRLLNHREVLCERDSEGLRYMPRVGFPDDGHDRRPCVEEELQ